MPLRSVRSLLFSALLAVLISACSDPSPEEATESLTVLSAWGRETLPGSKYGALYITIENESVRIRKLVELSTPAAAKAEIHNHISENNILKMVHVPELTVLGSTTLQFMPGGLHIMLQGLSAPLVAGSTLTLTLTFDSDQIIDIEVPILSSADALERLN